VVWKNEAKTMRKHYIGGDFGNVLIEIYPTEFELYLVRVQKDRPGMFGPLLDSSILPFKMLVEFVRSCCINGYRRFFTIIDV
jgi:hypothetical protein